MASDLAQKIDVFFDDVVIGFDAKNVSAKNVAMYNASANSLQEGGQTFYRPMPYLTEVKDGRDITSLKGSITELVVPSTLTDSHLRNIPLNFTGTDLNADRLNGRVTESAITMLSNKVDKIVAEKIAERGTLVVVNAGKINDYDKAAVADAIMLEQQATFGERCMLINPRMSVNLAGNLASRGTMDGAPMDAYTRSMLPPIAGFDTFRTDYQKTIQGSAGTGYLVNGADQDYTPVAKDINGIPVDNRQQTLAVDTGTGAAVGDFFTIANTNAVGQINKEDTGELKTFRILAIDGANWTISPAIVPADGADQSQRDYANVVATPADDAAITILNTTTKMSSTFFEKGAVEIITSEWNTTHFEETGKKVRKATTDSGITICLLADSDIDTLSSTYRFFIWANVEVLNPEMVGVMLEDQV